jgi:hypothetical protein
VQLPTYVIAKSRSIVSGLRANSSLTEKRWRAESRKDVRTFFLAFVVFTFLIVRAVQVFLKDTKVQKINREVVAGLMRKRLAKKPELADILIPK